MRFLTRACPSHPLRLTPVLLPCCPARRPAPQPRCVLIDTDTLNSLPDRELASGISGAPLPGIVPALVRGNGWCCGACRTGSWPRAFRARPAVGWRCALHSGGAARCAGRASGACPARGWCTSVSPVHIRLSTAHQLAPAHTSAEIIKYGLIRDAPLFEWLEANMGRLLARDPEVGGCALLRGVLAVQGAARAPPLPPAPTHGPAGRPRRCWRCRCRCGRRGCRASGDPLCSQPLPPAPCPTPPPQAFTYAIERSCVNKAEVVAADEKEGGVRATLNLGHTFGHAIETCTGALPGGRTPGLGLAGWDASLGLRPSAQSQPPPPCTHLASPGYGAWLHGEAVAAGTMMAADMSQRLGWIGPDLVQRIRALNEAAKLPVAPPPVGALACCLGAAGMGGCVGVQGRGERQPSLPTGPPLPRC